MILGWDRPETFSDEGLSPCGFQNPSEDIWSEGGPFHRFRLARHTDGLEPREQLEELRILGGLCLHAVEGDDVAQVAADGRSRNSRLGQVGLVGRELLPARGVQVDFGLVSKELLVSEEDQAPLVDRTRSESIGGRKLDEVLHWPRILRPIRPLHTHTYAA